MTDASETIERHLIRGALWGIPLGLGLTMMLIGQKVISIGTWPPVLTVLLGIVLGIAWSWFAPPKGPKAERPDDERATQPESAPGPADGGGEDAPAP